MAPAPGKPTIVTQDAQMLQILKLVRQVASMGSTLFITGESGTGKDLLAVYYHYFSSRRTQPFIKIDCASLTQELAESELFGHEKGAFSGAVKQKSGRFELANQGTLFLDQVEELPMAIQSKLTRTLQERIVERLGGSTGIPIDIQLVSASRNNIESMVQNGTFRKDLFYRLSIVPVSLPPLRNRSGDIPLLIKHFLDEFAVRYQCAVPRLQPGALSMLCEYPWPGNIRELENIIERLLIYHSDGHDVTKRDISEFLDETPVESSLDAMAEKNMSLAEVEKIYIQKILQKTRWNKSRAAKILGINRKTLLEKRKKYNIG